MIDIKKVLGFDEHSSSVQTYFDKSHATSSIYLSLIIIVLELWMITSLVINVFTGDKPRTTLWVIQHLSAYIVLLLMAVTSLLHSIRYLHGLRPNHFFGKVIRYAFSITCLVFGMYISYLDYAKGEQILAFVTMEVFVFGLLAWRPVVTFSMLSISAIVFYIFCNRLMPASYATKVNLFTTWVAVLVTGINLYHQKLAEASNNESLERINQYLKEKTVRDDLTGIPNMHYFRNMALTALLDEKTNLSKLVFLYLDIENFKSYNDRYGYPMGNELLKKCAEIIRSCFPVALIARSSDDHFVVLTEHGTVIERLDEARKKLQEDEDEVRLGLKVGAYTPKDRDTLPIVACDRARYACNSIKRKFNQNYCEYTEEMDADFHRKQYIINNIDKAIKEGDIHVYYQPVMRSEDKTLCGVEALARWEDPLYGMLPPGDFVPVLEEYRQIHKLDHCVLETACRDIAEARQTGTYYVPISINFSRLDFELVDVVGDVEACIAQYGIEKRDIHVEITESALSENDIRLQSAMERFRNEGYALWLDDFGSGYSGLNVLKDFEFDMMKIDMKFLTNFSANEKIRPILRSVVALAKEIGMHTLTEGVETDEAFEFLRSIGCERVQGFLFGKPMPKAQLLENITSGKYKIAPNAAVAKMAHDI